MPYPRALVLTLVLASLAAALLTTRPILAATGIRVEAEDYARYSDQNTENLGGSSHYTAPGPDIYPCPTSYDTCSNNHKVSAFYGGEWLEYDLAIPAGGQFALTLRYGTRSSGAVGEVLVDGQSLGGRFALPSTGHYDTLVSREVGLLTMSAGRHTLRLIAHGPFSVDYFELAPRDNGATPMPTQRPTQLPAPTAAPLPPAPTSSATQWQPWAATLTSARAYTNPCADVTVRVSFRAPSGRSFTTTAFWDGGNSFGVRMFFPETGRWSWETSASDTTNPGLHGVRGLIDVRPAAGSNPLFSRGALRVSANGRYLSYADGTPFFWLGDTAWAGPLKATDAEWQAYLDDRAAKGFSVIQVALSPSWAATTDVSGNQPSLGTSGTKWNPAFWQGFERKLAAANQRGLVVLVMGVMEPDASNLPEAAARRFARQLAGRLNGLHVIFSPSFDSPYEPLGDLVGQELDEATDLHLITQHPGTPSGQATNIYAERYFAQNYLQFSGNQTGHNGGDRERIARQEIAWNLSLYRRTPRKPVVNLEGYYDNAGGVPGARGADQGTAKDTRAGAYRSWLSGALGYSYGTVGLYQWVTTSGAPNHWRATLAYPSSRQMTVFRDLLSSLSWSTLEPAYEQVREQPALWSQRAVLAVTADRRMELAYTPVSRTLVIDMAAFGATVRATWVNPTTGQRTAASGLLAPSGVQRFTPPAGGDDWALLFQP